VRYGTARFRERARGAEDLDLLPLMNLFVVLVPMLLLSAVFLRISVLELALPGDSAAESLPPAADPVAVTVRIEPARWVVEVEGEPPIVLARPERTATAGSTTAKSATAGSASARAAGAAGADTGRLREELRRIAAAHPGSRDATVVSGLRTRYEEIVSVMDACREAGLPGVALAAAPEQGGADAPRHR
jgi:biopolymer transport protein ExbD